MPEAQVIALEILFSQTVPLSSFALFL